MKALRLSYMVLVAILIFSLFPATIANADSYSSPWIALSSTQNGNPGSMVQVLGYSFAPNAAISIGLGPSSTQVSNTPNSQLQQVATATANNTGQFSASITIPSNATVGETWSVGVTESMNNVDMQSIVLNFIIGKVGAYQQAGYNPPVVYSINPTNPPVVYSMNPRYPPIVYNVNPNLSPYYYQGYAYYDIPLRKLNQFIGGPKLLTPGQYQVFLRRNLYFPGFTSIDGRLFLNGVPVDKLGNTVRVRVNTNNGLCVAYPKRLANC